MQTCAVIVGAQLTLASALGGTEKYNKNNSNWQYKIEGNEIVMKLVKPSLPRLPHCLSRLCINHAGRSPLAVLHICWSYIW